MNTPQVTVCISTMLEDQAKILKIIDDLSNQTYQDRCKLIFIIQASSEDTEKYCSKLFSNITTAVDVTYFIFYEKGLARSRNRAIELADTEIILFGDTDCRYPPNSIQKILEHYDSNPATDFCSFQAEYIDDKTAIKAYPTKTIAHNMRSIMRVGSWEITLKREAVVNNNLSFDERFGLGSYWPSGAENVFLSDLLKAGLRGIFVPETIVFTIPSNDRDMNRTVIEAKGALLRRIWGIRGAFLGIPYLIRRQREGLLRDSFLRCIISLYRGWWQFPNAT